MYEPKKFEAKHTKKRTLLVLFMTLPMMIEFTFVLLKKKFEEIFNLKPEKIIPENHSVNHQKLFFQRFFLFHFTGGTRQKLDHHDDSQLRFRLQRLVHERLQRKEVEEAQKRRQDVEVS